MRWRVGVVMAAVVSLVLVGCANDDGILTDEEAIAEYTAAVKEWPPPPGKDYGPLAVRDGELRVGFAPGQPRSAAQWRWWCAWGKEWLEQRGKSEDRAKQALITLERVSGMDSYKKMPDWARDLDQIVNRAKLGDPAPMQADQEANC